MGRIRTIKPELARHEALFELEEQTHKPYRFAWVMLLTVCDREGRFRWNPRALKLDVLPYDDVDFGGMLDALVTAGMVVRYDGPDGKTYGCIPTFTRHQIINNRESPSSLPCQPGADDAPTTREARVDDASVTPDAPPFDARAAAVARVRVTTERRARRGANAPASRSAAVEHAASGEREREREREGERKKKDFVQMEGTAFDADLQPIKAAPAKRLIATAALEFEDEFWPAYPQKIGKKPAAAAWIKARGAASLAEIMDGLRRYKATKPADREWLHPTTFLNQERWTDQPAPPVDSSPVDGYAKLLANLQSTADLNEEPRHVSIPVPAIGR